MPFFETNQYIFVIGKKYIHKDIKFKTKRIKLKKDKLHDGNIGKGICLWHVGKTNILSSDKL